MYPFPILWFGNSISSLLDALPKRDVLMPCIESFQKRSNATSFPHMPAQQVSKKEVERFLEDAERNAESHPDMLALVFAMLATGSQMGVWDRCGGQWLEGEVLKATEQGNVYRELFLICLSYY